MATKMQIYLKKLRELYLAAEYFQNIELHCVNKVGLL